MRPGTGAGPGPGRLSKFLGWLLLLGVSALLVMGFVLWQLPYARFQGQAQQQLSSATGARVEIGELAGAFGLAGPGIRAERVQLFWTTPRAELEIERASLRPAWSLSWFRGRPALHVDALGPAGRVVGTVWPGERLGFAGRLESLDLAALPPQLGGNGGLPLTGILDAELDLLHHDGVVSGEARFEGRDGALAMAELPIAIPFAHLTGGLRMAVDGAIALQDIVLRGPMLSVQAQGSLGPARRLELAPLDLEIRLEQVDPAFRQLLSPLGIRLDAQGNGDLRLSGTLARPELR